MPTYDIIIPHYGEGRLTDLCLNCLDSIERYSQEEDYRVILVDNASPEMSAVRERLETIPSIILRMSSNLGFVKATNAGLRASTAPYLVLMNNDTEAAPAWLPKLRAPLTGTVGLSGPLTTTRESWQGRYTAGDGSVVILPKKAMLAFFCTMIRREVFEKIGFLDEAFGIGFGDDDFFCHQATKNGFDLALVRSLLIPHHHRSSFRTMYSESQIQTMQKRALDLFYHKSGRTR